MFLLTIYGWLIFRANELDVLITYTTSLFSQGGGWELSVFSKVILYVLPLILVQNLASGQIQSGTILGTTDICALEFVVVCALRHHFFTTHHANRVYLLCLLTSMLNRKIITLLFVGYAFVFGEVFIQILLPATNHATLCDQPR